MKPQKLPYQVLPESFRGNLKSALNAVLRSAGLEIGTTLKKCIEDARLRKLQEKGHWLEPRYTQGLALDSEAARTFVSETCLPYRAEWERLPLNPNGDETQYYLENAWFKAIDAEVLYSIVRRLQPVNIVEVGGGFSTRLMRRAITEGKLSTRITSIDPHPNTSVQPYADEYIRAAVEDVKPAKILNLLSAGDILFIDSSHTVKTGGDIPYLFLEILPRLRPGVFIHIHDIFLPFDYPEEWVLEDWRWNEQYLVHAFLAYNQTFEILWPASYMWVHHRSEILSVISTASASARPSSFWMKKLY
jgi:predicted O-methyltransferase YrrM